MKNPDSKPLRVVRDYGGELGLKGASAVSAVLVEMMKAQAEIIKAGKSSAIPHFIACIKELERIHGFKFEQIPEEDLDRTNG